jgi:hypothetical protein
MTCPTVIRVTTGTGPPGIGLPAGTADAGKFVRKAGSTPYAYELVSQEQVNNNLGTAASRDVPATGDASATQVVLGGDSRLSNSREWSAPTVDQPTAEAGISTVRAAFTPQRVFQAIAAHQAANTGTVGRAVAAAATQAEGRLALGLGSSATTDATAYATSAQGAKADSAVQPAVLNSGLAAKADLVGGLVPTSQIPSIALVKYLGIVTNQSAMLALRGQEADWCIRSDTSTEWVLVANDGSNLSDWIQMPTGVSPVSSVNGQTGSITLGTGNIAESSGNLYFTAARALSAALTNFTAGIGTVTASDSILSAIQKLVANDATRAIAGAIGSSGLTMTTNRILGRNTANTGAPEEFTPIGLAFSGSSLTTLSDLIIPVTDEISTITASTSVAKVTIPYWPRATVLTDLLIWAVGAAPTGASMQFDWKVGGTSIYSTLPTISAGSTNSTASAGTYSTTFTSSGSTIAVGSKVEIYVTQVGTGGGVCLKVVAPTKRNG